MKNRFVLLSFLVAVVLALLGLFLLRDSDSSNDVVLKKDLDHNVRNTEVLANDAVGTVQPRDEVPVEAESTSKGLSGWDLMSGEFILENNLRGVMEHSLRFLEPKITSDEMAKLTEIAVEAYKMKRDIESRHLMVLESDDDKLEVAIPAYLDEGLGLRNMFLGELRDAFPNGRFEQIDDFVGQRLDAYFYGFGIMDQLITVTRNEKNPLLFEINREGITVGELTPDRLPSSQRMTGLSDFALRSLDQMETGDFTYLKDIIQENFQ